MIELTAFEVVMVALAGAAVFAGGALIGAWIAFYAVEKVLEDDDALAQITEDIINNKE